MPDNPFAANNAIGVAQKLGFEVYGLGIRDEHITHLLPHTSRVVNDLPDLVPAMYALSAPYAGVGEPVNDALKYLELEQEIPMVMASQEASTATEKIKKLSDYLHGVPFLTSTSPYMNEAQLEEDRQRSKERTKCKIAITALKGPLEMLKRFAASTVQTDKRLQEQTCKVSRWLTACEKLVKQKLSREGQSEYWEVADRIDKFLPEEGMPTEPMIRRIVELYMAGLFLEWGVWATCKRYSKAQEWVYLDMEICSPKFLAKVFTEQQSYQMEKIL